MQNVINLIMARDGLRYDDAAEWVEAVAAEMQEIIDTDMDPMGALCECERIMREDLRLEPDYLFELIDV